jgi:citrate lyase subunit beta/citryl-CoA lyase
MIDLEDAVSLSGKIKARELAAEAIPGMDWRGKRVSCRVNSLGTPWGYDDLKTLTSTCGSALHAFVLPKIRDHHDVIAAQRFIRTRPTTTDGGRGMPELHVLVEDARAFVYLREILQHDAVQSVIFGVGDFSASLGLSADALGFGVSGNEEGGSFKAVRSVIAVIAKGMGATVIDTPFPDYSDADGFKAEARWARRAGFDGKWCIHPSQIELANEIFAPTDAEFRMAREICEVYKRFVAAGDSAALEWNGKMIDEATARIARVTYELGCLIGLGS